MVSKREGYPSWLSIQEEGIPREGDMGPETRKGPGTTDTLPPWADKHLQKHHLPATLLAVGKYSCTAKRSYIKLQVQ